MIGPAADLWGRMGRLQSRAGELLDQRGRCAQKGGCSRMGCPQAAPSRLREGLRFSAMICAAFAPLRSLGGPGRGGREKRRLQAPFPRGLEKLANSNRFIPHNALTGAAAWCTLYTARKGRQIMLHHLYILVAGIVFGLANVIPGVSGGTMTVVRSCLSSSCSAWARASAYWPSAS